MTPRTAMTGARRTDRLRRQAAKRLAAERAIRTLRKQARDEIDRLLAFLDATEPYPDAEPNLGWPEPSMRPGDGEGGHWLTYTSQGDQSKTRIEDGRCGTTDDREDDGDDREPSLCGVTAYQFNAYANREDELEGDGERGGEADLEPSLGSVTAAADEDQQYWTQGNSTDLEGDEHDGREPDEADNEPSTGFDEPELDNSDAEPALGWTESGAITTCRSEHDECEGDGHTGHVQDVEQARQRQPKSLTIRTEPAWGGFAARRILNLTETQRALVKPRLKHGDIRT